MGYQLTKEGLRQVFAAVEPGVRPSTLPNGSKALAGSRKPDVIRYGTVSIRKK